MYFLHWDWRLYLLSWTSARFLFPNTGELLAVTKLASAAAVAIYINETLRTSIDLFTSNIFLDYRVPDSPKPCFPWLLKSHSVSLSASPSILVVINYLPMLLGVRFGLIFIFHNITSIVVATFANNFTLPSNILWRFWTVFCTYAI